jgi:hypothetical protein
LKLFRSWLLPLNLLENARYGGGQDELSCVDRGLAPILLMCLLVTAVGHQIYRLMYGQPGKFMQGVINQAGY